MGKQTDQTEIPGTTRSRNDPVTPGEPTAVNLPARRDWTLVAQGLELKRKHILALAEKAEQEGYHTDARNYRMEADAIKDRILPAVREQREFAFADPREMRFAVANLLRQHVMKAATMSVKAKPKLEELLDEAATGVIAALEHAYAFGFQHGRYMRDADPALAIVKAADKARLADASTTHPEGAVIQ